MHQNQTWGSEGQFPGIRDPLSWLSAGDREIWAPSHVDTEKDSRWVWGSQNFMAAFKVFGGGQYLDPRVVQDQPGLSAHGVCYHEGQIRYLLTSKNLILSKVCAAQ